MNKILMFVLFIVGFSSIYLSCTVLPVVYCCSWESLASTWKVGTPTICWFSANKPIPPRHNSGYSWRSSWRLPSKCPWCHFTRGYLTHIPRPQPPAASFWLECCWKWADMDFCAFACLCFPKPPLCSHHIFYGCLFLRLCMEDI